ncbi:hypothetical protein ACJX0J_012770, partial [Zea mays]
MIHFTIKSRSILEHIITFEFLFNLYEIGYSHEYLIGDAKRACVSTLRGNNEVFDFCLLLLFLFFGYNLSENQVVPVNNRAIIFFLFFLASILGSINHPYNFFKKDLCYGWKCFVLAFFI